MAAPTTPLEARLVEAQVLEILAGLLRERGNQRAVAGLTAQSSFDRDLGLASLDLVELVVRCEARLDIELPDDIADQADTPAAWVRAILQGGLEAEAKTVYRVVPPSRAAEPPPSSCSTLVDVLQWRAERDPGRIHVHLLEEGTGTGIGYGALWEAAGAVAAGLIGEGLRPGDTVAILLASPEEFLHAFCGVQLAGGIPVPIYPPARPDRIEEYVGGQLRILRNAGVRMLISFDRLRPVAQVLRVNLPGLIDVTTVAALRAARGRADAVRPAEIALVQYTSGSTGDPKGVALTHANLLANIGAIGNAVHVGPEDSVVSWLPLASDLGLVGCWLFSLVHATPLTLLSPLEFLARPESWLWAIHDSRGTLSAAPNHAYELCARRIPAWTLEGLDLGSWRAAVNAGEPVLPGTIRRFSDRFRAFGFRASTMLACYGLAESSVALAIPPPGRTPVVDRVRRGVFERSGQAVPASTGDAGALEFVSVGAPLEGHHVRVIDETGDETGDELAERVEGRILFRGPSATAGYWRNPSADAAVLSDGWRDTGDLGYLADGALYVTGRSKESILKGGRGISPVDVETAAGEVPGVIRGAVAAVGVTDPNLGTERLVVVAETPAEDESGIQRIRDGIHAAVTDKLGVVADAIELIPPGWLPKTSNGKLRRQQTGRLHARGKLAAQPGPPWLQMARLWWRNLGPLAVLAWRRLWQLGRRGARSTLVSVAAVVFGFWIRLTGASPRPAARRLLWLTGHRIHDAEWKQEASLVVASRAGLLDPLAVAACLAGPLRFAGVEALAGLPGWARFLLRPILVSASPESIRKALDRGDTVVVFPDAPAGSLWYRSRFRLGAFQAALAHRLHLVPAIVRIRSRGRGGGGAVVQLRLGRPIDPGAPGAGASAADLRERVRSAIGELNA